nr:heterodisulfide reductase-related iron-sulfur binding cluster [Bacillus velezensis]
MKVSLFVTCLVDMFQTNVGKATVEVLERLGCEVDFPEGQICCGAPRIQQRVCDGCEKSDEADDCRV